jgi:hypothetical protein
MKSWFAIAAGTAPLLATSVALAQSGSMMNGGGWDMGWMGGYLLVVVVAGVVALVMQGKGK